MSNFGPTEHIERRTEDHIKTGDQGLENLPVESHAAE